MKIPDHTPEEYSNLLRKCLEDKRKETTLLLNKDVVDNFNPIPFMNYTERHLKRVANGLDKDGWSWFDKEGSMDTVNKMCDGACLLDINLLMIRSYLDGDVGKEELKKKYDFHNMTFLYRK